MVSEPSIVALIPARGGSKRIPGKNIKPLAGRPLLAYTIAAAQQAGIFREIIVSTEDCKIGGIATQHGAFWVPRHIEMSADDSPDIDWVDFTIRALRLSDKADSFAILRPTSPFRTAETIRRAWEQWCKRGRIFDSLRAIEPARQHPGKMWVMDDRCQAPLSPLLGCCARARDWLTAIPPAHSRPTQTLPAVYAQNASLEITWVNTVLQQHSISGELVMPFLTQGWEGFDLNDERDWLLAEAAVERGLAKLPLPLEPMEEQVIV